MEQKKKIAFVIGSLTMGGAERHLVTIAPHLVEAGFYVDVITMSDLNPLASQLRSPYISVKPPAFPKWIVKLPFFIRRIFSLFYRFFFLCSLFSKNKRDEGRYDIIHFFLPEAYIMGMMATLLVRHPAKKVMSRRSLNEYGKRRPLLYKIEKRLHYFVDYVLANSERVMEQLNLELPCKIKRAVIYNGLDFQKYNTDRTQQELRSIYQIPQKAFVMCIVANLIPYKGHKDLITALGQVKDKLPKEWFLLIVGQDRGAKSSLQDLAISLEIDSHIQWYEDRYDVQNFYKAADLALLVSHEEGFSNAILEAMYCQLPLIVTDVGGNAEAVEDGRNGLVVPSRSPGHIAQAIEWFLCHPDQIKEMGKEGAQRVGKKFTLHACVGAYKDLYNDLISLKG